MAGYRRESALRAGQRVVQLHARFLGIIDGLFQPGRVGEFPDIFQHASHLREDFVEIDLVEPFENPHGHGLRLLERVWNGGNFLQRGTGRRDHLNGGVRFDVQRHVHQAGDEAVGAELRAHPFANQVGNRVRIVEVDGGAAVGNDFFLIELDDDRDAHVGAQLAVDVVDVLLEAQLNPLDHADLDALELDRRAGPQAVHITGEVDDEFVGLAEQVPRAEDHDRHQDQTNGAEYEGAHGCRIDSLTHDPSLICPLYFLPRRGSGKLARGDLWNS